VTEVGWEPLGVDPELDDYRRWVEYKTSTVCSMFGMTREQLGLEPERPTMIGDNTLKRLAAMLGVDELGTFSTARNAIGFTVRVGSQRDRVEIDLDDLSTGSANNVVMEALFRAATAAKIRAQQDERRRALQALIGSARPVVPVPMEVPSSRLLEGELPGEPDAPKSRFEAVAEEIMDT